MASHELHIVNRPREDGKLFFFLLNYSYQCWPDGPLGTYTLFYNIFYENIEAEICEIFNNNFKNKAEAEIFEKDRYNFVC